jgi:uncharacterized protein YndB with AHSA1/START domain
MQSAGFFVALLLLVAAPALAKVQSSGPGGFAVVETAVVSAPPARAYAALRDIGHWWDSRHSFSGEALNLTLSLKAGGCFCETLPGGGFARHMEVVAVAPGNFVILRGELGPLADQGVTGAMKIVFAPAPQGSTITLSYAVGGYMPQGGSQWAAPVDRVLGEQLQRLTRFIDSGTPEARGKAP